MRKILFGGVKDKSCSLLRYSLVAVGIALTSLIASASSADAATYYVSVKGSNQDGKTWASAWKEFDQINWDKVHPRDTIVLDGGNGNSSMTYYSALKIPIPSIVVTRTSEPGHNGLVILEGGGLYGAPLPQGIAIMAMGVRLEGLGWRGISVRNCGVGLTTGANYTNVLVRNVELRNNRLGAVVAGHNSRFDQIISHDNTDRNFSTEGCGSSETVSLTSSWIYNTTPGATGSMPSRGIQTASGKSSTLNINRCVIGPGLCTGVEVNDYVYILNSLLINATDASIGVFQKTTHSPLFPLRFKAKNVTSFMTNRSSVRNYAHYCVAAVSAPTGGPIPITAAIENSIFYGGEVHLRPDQRYATDTTQFRVTGNTMALSDTMVDPKFKSDVGSIPDDANFNTLNQLDFSLQPTSPVKGRGSNLSSSRSLTGP